MVSPRFVKIFSITLIVALLSSSVESASKVECPSTAKSNVYSKETLKTFIVMLDGKSSVDPSVKTEQSIKDHFAVMSECWKKRVERVSGNNTSDDILEDFSVQGLAGYVGKFGDKFVANELAKMKGVKYVEESQVFKINYAIDKRTVVKNPTFNIDRIDQAKFPLDKKFTFPDTAGEGVDIYVIDTGISTTNSEFGKRAKSGGAFCTGCNDKDENGHGTHVASIAGGKTLGVARKANLIGIRVLDANGSGDNAGVIKGMTAVIDQHNKSKNKKSVVNMSLGGGFSQAVNDAVTALTKAGVHVAVAAGNESADSCKSSPASAPEAITVGATEKANDDITDFSNFGKCNDIFAPGRDITGADFQDDNGQVVFSGTSQASPHVAGTLALIIAKDGNKSPAEMAKALSDLSTKGVVTKLDKASPNKFLRVPAP